MSDENNPERREAWERPADTEAAKYGFDRAEEPGTARRRAFNELVQREKARAEALGEPYEITVDGITTRIFEDGGDVKTVVEDADTEVAMFDLAPANAEAMARALWVRARKARGDGSEGYKTRPWNVNHVSAKIREGHVVDRINLAEYAQDGVALQAVTNFIASLGASGFSTRPENGSVVIYRKMTTEEQEATLARAQKDWEATRDLYEYHAERGTAPGTDRHWERDKIRKFCEAEDLPLPWGPDIGSLR